MSRVQRFLLFMPEAILKRFVRSSSHREPELKTLILPAEDDSKRPPSHNDDKEAVGYVSVMGQEIESRVLFSSKAGVQ